MQRREFITLFGGTAMTLPTSTSFSALGSA
jgi:hypothetical protein